MWIAVRAAQLWLENHSQQEWKDLLADYERVPVLREDVIGWLAATTAEAGEPIMTQFNVDDATEGGKSFSRFEDAFIANVSAAAERAQ